MNEIFAKAYQEWKREKAELDREEAQCSGGKLSERIGELREKEKHLRAGWEFQFDRFNGKIVNVALIPETTALVFYYGRASGQRNPNVRDTVGNERLKELAGCFHCAPEALRVLESLGVIQTDDNLILYQPTREFWARTGEGWRKIE